MLDVIEDVRNEFKIKLTDKFEEEVISFLNTSGGNLYIGVNDKGNVVGINGNIDLLQRTIKDRIKDNIMPSTIGLYDVIVLEKENNNLTEIQNSIIGLMLDSPTITQEKLARLLDVNIRTIQRNIKILIENGLIERTGATKKGEWIIKNNLNQ